MKYICLLVGILLVLAATLMLPASATAPAFFAAFGGALFAVGWMYP